jgi:hypothetical protein
VIAQNVIVHKVLVFLPLGNCTCVCQLPVIKRVAGKLSDNWMHSVLHSQSHNRVSRVHEPFKQTALVLGQVFVVRHDSGWKLLVVTDKHNPLWVQTEG